MSETFYPYARPLYVMAKPAGPRCNLACQYCYYLEKKAYYSEQHQREMSSQTLEQYIRQYIEAQTGPEVCFTWHGGEPMLRPIAFYRRAIALQQHYANGRRILNCIQTNGMLINDEWATFFRQEGWLVGISIDGDEQMHNTYRTNRAGKGSWSKVMRGIDILRRHGVEWNAMATVHQANVHHPEAFYHFFRHTLGATYLQFTPIVERLLTNDNSPTQLATATDTEATLAPYSVKPLEWGHFLCTLFDQWVRADVGQFFVQIFDATLANWMGQTPGVCVLANSCGHAAVMEHNGDIYSCDHFVFPNYYLGNIHKQTIVEMLNGPRQAAFSQIKSQALTRQCRQCQWLHLCHGECPRLRFAKSMHGEPGHNYLCPGYQLYFSHTQPHFDYMARALRANLPASTIMQFLK